MCVPCCKTRPRQRGCRAWTTVEAAAPPCQLSTVFCPEVMPLVSARPSRPGRRACTPRACACAVRRRGQGNPEGHASRRHTAQRHAVPGPKFLAPPGLGAPTTAARRVARRGRHFTACGGARAVTARLARSRCALPLPRLRTHIVAAPHALLRGAVRGAWAADARAARRPFAQTPASQASLRGLTPARRVAPACVLPSRCRTAQCWCRSARSSACAGCVVRLPQAGSTAIGCR